MESHFYFATYEAEAEESVGYGAAKIVTRKLFMSCSADSAAEAYQYINEKIKGRYEKYIFTSFTRVE
jgi:hypothetical protein